MNKTNFDKHIKDNHLYLAYSGFVFHVACTVCKEVKSFFGDDIEILKFKCKCT